MIAGWARLGFSGDFGGAWFLTHLVGPSRALELLVTNAPIAADEALALGLVNRVVPDAEFADAWRAWAQELAAGPTGAIAGMKANVHDALRLALAGRAARETARMSASGRHPRAPRGPAGLGREAAPGLPPVLRADRAVAPAARNR